MHYQQDYDNAFWNGTQLVFGDGDGHVFGSFTKPVDVLGHEFTHAVTQFTANLTYQGQSGALNESVSDCFGMCVKQRVLGQTAEAADWLVGAGIFLPGIHARALRDMAHPGTAYDDPTLGKDPQVGDMADYVETTDDNGGVHTNSGIPNRAFYLAATAIGGDTWEGAGQIWYAALTGGQVTAATDFAGFAVATIAAAGDHADAVRQAWATVGVDPSSAPGRRRRREPQGSPVGRARTPHRRHRRSHDRGLGRPGRRRPTGHRGPRPRRPARPEPADRVGDVPRRLQLHLRGRRPVRHRAAAAPERRAAGAGRTAAGQRLSLSPASARSSAAVTWRVVHG